MFLATFRLLSLPACGSVPGTGSGSFAPRRWLRSCRDVAQIRRRAPFGFEGNLPVFPLWEFRSEVALGRHDGNDHGCRQPPAATDGLDSPMATPGIIRIAVGICEKEIGPAALRPNAPNPGASGTPVKRAALPWVGHRDCRSRLIRSSPRTVASGGRPATPRGTPTALRDNRRRRNLFRHLSIRRRAASARLPPQRT